MSLRDANPSNKKNPKRIAIVIANPATSSTTPVCHLPGTCENSDQP